MKRRAAWACASVAVLGCAAHAAVFPEKPVRIVVPYPPAGPTDILARIVGEKLTAALAQPVLVDNRAGAGGVVGSEAVAKAPPDGHTLVWATSGSHAINATLQPRLPYDPVKDFAPITLVAQGANISPAELADFLRREIARWGEVVKRSGAKSE